MFKLAITGLNGDVRFIEVGTDSCILHIRWSAQNPTNLEILCTSTFLEHIFALGRYFDWFAIRMVDSLFAKE